MAEFIDVPIVTDPAALEQLAYDALQSAFPGFAPADGNLDTIQIQALARIASVVANLASAVPKSIARFIGPLLGISPINATTASVTSTWTMVDNTGHTIAAGTLVGIPDAAGNLVPFTTLADVVVAPGATATADGAVTLVAVTPGSAGSGLGAALAAVTKIDELEAVSSVVLTAATTGGVDAEDDNTYLNRFATQAQLLAPRPILPADFAALLESIPGIERALAMDGYIPAVNEVETVTVNATGGTFTLTFSGQTTAAIAFNATAGAVQSALEALSNIAPGDITVTGGPEATGPVTVEFRGAYAGTNVTQMTANSGSLTGGTHTATVATTIGGAAAQTGQERAITLAAVDEAGNAPSGGAIAAGQALLEADREVNFVVHVIPPTYTTVDVAYTITIEDGFDPADTNTLAEAAVAAFLNPAGWGIPVSGDGRNWVDEPTVRYNDLAWVLKSVKGVRHVTALTLGVHGGSLSGADVALTGPAALPTAGTLTGTTA